MLHMDIHNTAPYYKETSGKRKRVKTNIQAHLLAYRFKFYVGKNYENQLIYTVAHTIYAQSHILKCFFCVKMHSEQGQILI